MLDTFSTQEEAENFAAYMKTQFVEFVLRVRAISQHFTADKYDFVPDQQDYTRTYNSEDMYEKYNLSKEEIDFIESKFK